MSDLLNKLEAASKAGTDLLWMRNVTMQTTRFDEKLQQCLDFIPVDEFVLTLMCQQKLKDQPVQQIYELDRGTDSNALYFPKSVVAKISRSPSTQEGLPIFAANPSLAQSGGATLGSARFYSGYTKPSETRTVESFATFCTEPYLPELRLMLKSLALFHPKQLVYVVGDEATREAVESGFDNAVCITASATLPAVANTSQSRHDHSPIGIYALKMLACDWALETNSNVVYCDADMIFTDRFPDVPNCDVAFALHGQEHFEHTEQYGLFNAGLVFCARRDFIGWWRDMYLRSDSYVDQSCLDFACDAFDTHILPPVSNYGHWRLWNNAPGSQFRPDMPTYDAMLCAGISTGPDGIHFAGRRLQSFHVHLLSDISKLHPNNALLRRIALFALEHSGRQEHLELFRYYQTLIP